MAEADWASHLPVRSEPSPFAVWGNSRTESEDSPGTVWGVTQRDQRGGGRGRGRLRALPACGSTVTDLGLRVRTGLVEEVVGAWMVPSRQPASFLSTLQSPMAPWSRSPWRTARWCGRRGGSFSDSECAPGQGGGWATEISPGTPQSFLSPLGTMSSQDPCWPQPRGPITLWGWSVGRLLAGGSPGRPPHLESNPTCPFPLPRM